MVLGSKFPACIVWGAHLTTIHNDAFRPILGAKPEALGRPFSQVWSEAWETIGPIAERAFAGEATFIEDFPLSVERNGYPEEAFFTFCYSPIRDETGRVAGLLNTIVETTGKVLAERKQAFLLHLEEKLRGLADPHRLTLSAAEALGRHVAAARAGYGEIDAAGTAVAVERDWTDGTVASLTGKVRLLDAFGPAVIAELRAGRTLVVEDCLTDPRSAGEAHAATWASIGTRSLIVVPLLRDGRLTAILYVHEPQPRHWSVAEVSLAEHTAQRTWAAVERARAEAQLRESEARLRLMADAVPQIVWITDAEGRAEFFNRHWSDYTGAAYEPTTAAKVAARFVHPDDAALTMERFEAAQRTGGTFLVEHRIRSKEGGYRWFLVRGEPYRDPRSGEIVRWFGASVDIHDRKHAEAALLEREERLRLIVENARDYAIFTTDPEGRINSWLPGAASVFGWSEEEAIGRPLAMTFTLEDQEAGLPNEELETARREGVALNVRWHLRKDGSRVPIEGRMTALRDANGDIRGFLKIGQDSTGRKRAEEANARLAAIVTSTTDAIIAFAAEDGQILSWNKGAEELFGYAEAEALGGPVGLLVPPDQPDGDATGVFRRTMDGERVHEHETARVTKSGTRVPVTVTSSRMLAADGRVIGVAAIFRDMRQRKAAEERQALLAREVDHRAKNALAVVQSLIQMTAARDPAAFKRAVTGRISALARAQTLLAEDRWSGADLRTLLTGELEPFLGDRRAELEGPQVALPPGAAQPMAMAIHELATNAVKYGALSVVAGRLSVSWHLAWRSDRVPLLRLRWAEIGGPPVVGTPERRGFGSRVLDGTLRSQLSGQVSLVWETTGLICDVEVPLVTGVEKAGAVGASAAS
ncbi:PAS domain S-box protein [Roseomonas sp. GCM10028921]